MPCTVWCTLLFIAIVYEWSILVWQIMYYIVVAGVAWNSFREPYDHSWGVHKTPYTCYKYCLQTPFGC